MAILKKTFIITELGSPFSWTQEYINHVQHLGKYGWEWKILTPNKYEVPEGGNVEVIPFTCDDLNKLCKEKLGVESKFFITEKGTPSVHITDYYVASGVLFHHLLQDSDFWGITNMDIVYGRLDHFLPESMLEGCDVFSDDLNAINGIFCLFRNHDNINKLFMRIPDWQAKFGQEPCKRCVSGEGQHTLFGTDEYDMTEVMKQVAQEGNVRYACPQYYPMHSHDRLEQHRPEVKLEIKPDGSLWELFEDIGGPQWIHARPFLGNEIAYFHFQRTKTWPTCLNNDLS